MTISPVDSAVLGNLFTTPEMRAVFSDDARFQRMLDVEAALARAEAGNGLIPPAAAAAISPRARLEHLDRDGMAHGTELAGYPIIPLVKALVQACSEDAGRFVHWGATTQDIIDTGVVLQVRDGLRLLDADLRTSEQALRALAMRYRNTPMAGRTHLQHALPITLGFKAATWLDPLQRHRRRLARLEGDALVVQFGGAAGTLASLGADGIRVLEALARELGLGTPAIAWHTARDRLAEVVAWLGLLTGSLAKIAQDVALLMQSEVGEIAEPYQPGRGGSSTMPQKRNPIASEFVLAAAAGVRQLVPLMLGAMVQDHERATGPWHSEWLALPQAFALTAGALHHTRLILEGLEVDEAAMRRNLELTRGMISAEAVMMALAPAVGRSDAHHIVADACRAASADGRHLAVVLKGMSAVTDHLGPGEIDRLLGPESYTGLAGAFVDRVLVNQPEGE